MAPVDPSQVQLVDEKTIDDVIDKKSNLHSKSLVDSLLNLREE